MKDILSEQAVTALMGTDMAILATVLAIAAFVQTGIGALFARRSLSYHHLTQERNADRLLRVAGLQVVASGLGTLSGIATLVCPCVVLQVLTLILTSASVLMFGTLSLSTIWAIGRMQQELDDDNIQSRS